LKLIIFALILKLFGGNLFLLNRIPKLLQACPFDNQQQYPEKVLLIVVKLQKATLTQHLIGLGLR
jgi:hypothetical protein